MKFKPQINDLSDVILVYNPFCLKNDKGTLMVFETYEEAYVELLRRLYKAGPTAVDPVVFLCDNLGMANMDAVDFVKSWGRKYRETTQLFLFDWSEDNRETDYYAREFCWCMHQLSETQFNEAMFNNALCRIKKEIRTQLKKQS